jgi:glycosyl transferase family 25
MRTVTEYDRDTGPSRAGRETLLDGFERVRIINLRNRPDRRRETERELAAHGMGVDGTRVAFFEAIAPVDAGGFPNPGVRGCYLSHLALLEAARADGIRHLLVLEDDIAFVRDADRLGPAAVAELQARDWDIAYLGHTLPASPGPPGWRPVYPPVLNAHCYALHARVLPRLIPFLRAVLARPPGHPEGGPMHYDGALNTFMARSPDLQALYYTRSLAYQRPSRTDLHRQSLVDRSRWLRPFARLLRGVKRGYLKRIR